jgi:hypothetical protein
MINFQSKKRAMLLETYGFSVHGGKKHSECNYYVNIEYRSKDLDSYSFAFQDNHEASVFFDIIKKNIEEHNFDEPLLFIINEANFKLIKEPDRLVIGKY